MGGPIAHGIEQELQIVDPRTGRLVHGRLGDVMANLSAAQREHAFAGIGPDGFTSQLECRVGILSDLADCERALLSVRRAAIEACSRAGLTVIASGVNPLCRTETTGENFGEHHHVGMASADEAVAYANLVRWFIPELIALSANSRVYAGADTGFASYRLYRTHHCSLPPHLNARSVAEVKIFSHNPEGGGDARRFLDVTPFVKRGLRTVEIRLFDVGAAVSRTTAIATLLQALLSRLRKDPDLADALSVSSQRAESELASNRQAAVSGGDQGRLTVIERPVLPLRTQVSAQEALQRLAAWIERETLSLDRSGALRRNLDAEISRPGSSDLPQGIPPERLAITLIDRTRKGAR